MVNSNNHSLAHCSFRSMPASSTEIKSEAYNTPNGNIQLYVMKPVYVEFLGCYVIFTFFDFVDSIFYAMEKYDNSLHVLLK